jgi:hypothetical protein
MKNWRCGGRYGWSQEDEEGNLQEEGGDRGVGR